MKKRFGFWVGLFTFSCIISFVVPATVFGIDVANEYKAMFEGMWPRALKDLKELAERA